MSKQSPIQPRPVFVIGAARSGTKYLRDLVTESPSTCVIPFDVNFLWRLGSESSPHDELSGSDLSPAQRERVRRSIVRAAAWKPGKVLVEKTVSNALRVDFVKTIFPEARFVHLIRDGRSVIESVRRVWDIPTTLKYKISKLRYYPWTNLRYAARVVSDSLPGNRTTKRVWGVRYNGIDKDLESQSRLQICANQWVNCIEISRKQLADVPPTDVLNIRYEDMLQDENVFQGYCDFVGIPSDDSVRQAHGARTRTDTTEKWRGCFTEQDIQEVAPIIDPIQQRLGYGTLGDCGDASADNGTAAPNTNTATNTSQA